MKFTRYFLMFAAAAGVLSACTKLDQTRVLPIGEAAAPSLHELPTEIVITKDNQADELTFTWDAADFGAPTEILYSIVAARTTDGATPLVIFSGITETSYTFNKEVLNGKMSLTPEDGGLGIPVNEASEVNFYLSATVGSAYHEILSDKQMVMVTPTDAEKVYPNIWVIGDYCGWDHGKAQWLYNFTRDDANYEGVIDFGEKAANGFKMSGEAGWNNGNWGLDGTAPAPAPEAASITLINDGGSGNISAYSQRFYKFSFNKSTLELKKIFSFDKIGVIGDGANGWGDADDMVMNFNPSKRRFWTDVDLKAGGIKFRADGGSALSWGTTNQDGKLDGGDNINVEAGKVRIYVYLSDSNDLHYELNAKAYGTEEEGGSSEPEPEPEFDWFYHGQTTEFPDWTDIGMTKDGDDYKVNVTVDAGQEFLFKSGDGSSWVAAASAEVGVNTFFATLGTDAKINVAIATAGTYDVWYFPARNLAMVAQKVADQWGLVGSISKWGGLPDFYMTLDTASGKYVARNVALTTSDEFKIRFNDEWNDAKNYGLAAAGIFPVGELTGLTAGSGSQNMKVAADGSYDFWFDQPSATLLMVTAGTVPTF